MEKVTKVYRDYKKIYLLSLFILFGLLLTLGLAVYHVFTTSADFWARSVAGFSASFVLLNTILAAYKFKIVRRFVVPDAQKTDPILLLMGKGLDLYAFLDSIRFSSADVHRRLDSIEEEIKNLDSKVEGTKQDMDRIFAIVTQLANQEVSLMDDVGKTSGEIRYMFEIINLVVQEIEARNKNMHTLMQRSEEGNEKAGITNQLIRSVSSKSNEMLKMVDFINKVTKETNLLAINAAIEASHSGEESKGFAVIADEMKKLALLTSQKAKEVSSLMKGNVNYYIQATQVSEESGKSFQFIAEEIRQISGTIAEVVQTISEIKSRGSKVIQIAETMDKSAEAVRNSSGEVYGEIVAVNETLTELSDLSQKVKQEIHIISELHREILTNTELIHEEAKKINDRTDQYLGFESLDF